MEATVPDIETIRARLTPERMRRFQLAPAISAALHMVLLAVLFFLFGLGSASPVAESDLSFMNILALVYAAESLLLGLVLTPILVKKLGSSVPAGWSASSGRQPDAMDIAVTVLERSRTVRVAIYTGIGVTGLVLVLFGLIQGLVFSHPEYLACIVPACIVLGFLAATFPTQDRVAAEVQRRMR